MGPVTKHPEVIYTELEDGAVLLHMESGFYYSLDAAGLEIWRQVDAGRDAAAAGRALAERFAVAEDRAAASAAGFIEQLARERLVVPLDEGSAPTAEAPAHSGSPDGVKRPFVEPALIKHDEPLHQIAVHPFDPQLPLAE